MPKIKRYSKDTLTAIECELEEILEFEKINKEKVEIIPIKAWTEIFFTNLKELKKPEKGARTNYRFHVAFLINKKEILITREVGTQNSFYEPLAIEGLWIWLDAIDEIFTFLNENHGECRPKKQIRYAVMEHAFNRICPDILHPWCPLPKDCLRIEDCFRGEDCWLGAFDGVEAHGGLDINHPRGTQLWAPIDIHDHFYFNSLELGHNNNRWRGVHRFKNGAEWVLQSHHMITLEIPEHAPIKKGQFYSSTAGVYTGKIDHSHFVFKIYDYGELILIDPWILFWQMYRDLDYKKQIL